MNSIIYNKDNPIDMSTVHEFALDWGYLSPDKLYQDLKLDRYHLLAIYYREIAACLYYFEGVDELEVLFLYTKPNFRHKGLGLKLLRQIQTHYKNHTLHLEVSSANTIAQSLYKKAGFQQVNKRPKYYKNGEDALVFIWKGSQ